MRRFGWSLVAVILLCAVVARAQILSSILNDSNHAAGGAAMSLDCNGGACPHINVGTVSTTQSLTTAGSSGCAMTAITDNGGGTPTVTSTHLTWTQQGRTVASAVDTLAVWTAPYASALAAETITYGSLGGAFSTIDAWGVANATSCTLDGSVVTAITDPQNITTTKTGDFISCSSRFSASPETAGSGWTLISGADFQGTEYQVSNAGTYSCSWTSGSGAANGLIALALHP
jgi:hypothetical protein